MGNCDFCNKPISQPIVVSNFVVQVAINRGFNPYETHGIDLSQSIQIAHAMSSITDERQLKEALFQNWKQMALQNLTDWELCHDCNEAFIKATQESSSCFIATAAYSSMDPDVILLRFFRDEYLINKTLGKVFMKLYYKISPPVAYWISMSNNRKLFTRTILALFIKLVKIFLHKKFSN